MSSLKIKPRKPKTSDISDEQVVWAYAITKGSREAYPYDYLMQTTGFPFKVCYAAMQRAERRGLVDYGVSLRTGWLTPTGQKLFHEVYAREAGDAQSA